jgi:hypothetical protein
MTKTGLEFKILVIVICLLFEICDLEFLFLPNSLAISPGKASEICLGPEDQVFDFE